MEKLRTQYAGAPVADETPGGMDFLVTHLGAAYNLARWLLRNRADAEDAVQDAYVRALHHFKSFRGGDGRAWLLTIVRNLCYDRLKRRVAAAPRPLNEDTEFTCPKTLNPESTLLRQEETERMTEALESLPPQLREVLVLRELEEMSYRQIAAAVEIPMGTVMSRLSRAREQLQQIVFSQTEATETA